MTAKDDRAERLAQALRDNLRRRKAQARSRPGSQPAEDDRLPGEDSDNRARDR